MRKVWVIAARDYNAAVRTKAFLIGLLIMPVMMGGSLVMQWLLQGLPGVLKVADYGRWQELRLDRGADAQQLLRTLLDRTPVRHFELARPSLHDIFVRIAGPEAEEGEVHA